MTSTTPTSDQRDLVMKTLTPMRSLFSSTKTQTLSWRLSQLSKMSKLLTENTDTITNALHTDLGKDYTDSFVSEVASTMGEVDYAISNVKRWMKPQKRPVHPLHQPARAELKPEPRGVSLVIGPFNFPVCLTLIPVINALAAGCPVVIKLSDICPTVSQTMARLVNKYFSPDDVVVLEGGIPITTALLEQPWGLICFTGSTRVGKIVAKAAAETLTPVVLELGGLSPVYIDCDDGRVPQMSVMADRIVWGKTFNSGQVCVAPNHVFIKEGLEEDFCVALKNSIKKMYGENPQKSEMSRIVTKCHAERLKTMIQEVEGDAKTKIIYGGSDVCDVDDRYVCPTIIINPPLTSRVAQEEIFGPILVIYTITSEDEAIERINQTPGTPLAIYVFSTSSATYERIQRCCPSGAITKNDVIIHFSMATVPVGGLGTSGYGQYHGKDGFDAFSHYRPSITKPCNSLVEFGGIRYHPFKGTKGVLLCKAFSMKVPNMNIILGLLSLGLYAAFGTSIRSFLSTGLRQLADLVDF